MSINVLMSKDGQHKCYVCFNFAMSEVYIVKCKEDNEWKAKEIEVPNAKFLDILMKEICDLPQNTDLVEVVNNILISDKKGDK